MKILPLIFFILTLGAACSSESEKNPDTKTFLWYTQPAEKWVEALPIGNGSIGAMVYGTIGKEHIQFNEETLWTGEPHDYAHKGAYEYLDSIRNLLFAGEQVKAQNLGMEHFMSVPLHQKAYQPFADLFIDFKHNEGMSSLYTRQLDLENAIHQVKYTIGDTVYNRTMFASNPDKAIIILLEANKPDALTFELSFTAEHKYQEIFKIDENTIGIEVKVENGALFGVAHLKVVKRGGAVEVANGKIKVVGSNEVMLQLTAATNYVNYIDVSGNPKAICEERLNMIDGLTYNRLLERHLDDYKNLYDRFAIQIGEPNDSIPTDVRISNYVKSPDPSLSALYVQYGRYLMIACSRPGTQPANLQGIWNDRINPPWESKWTVNINTEMNYWLAEQANLPECHEALFGMIKEVGETGKSVAKQHYNARGWVLHHNTDIWRGAAPINHSNHGLWVTGGAWLSHHFWEHYQYTQDKEFLREEAYPIMLEASKFFVDFLIEDPKTGYLISTPSNSPEIGGMVAGPTMDHQIIRSLFQKTIKTANILGENQPILDSLSAMEKRIAPTQIGKHGQIQEWMEDIDDPNNKHRHISHLWAHHPGDLITLEDNPELAAAVKASLIHRGDAGTGWSLAWKINQWARMKDGNHAADLLNLLFVPAETPDNPRGGSYPNLFDSHPPFQIDGNFGAAAGILEMIVQSHRGVIEILPALPDLYPNGQVKGLKARGGFELDVEWANGALKSVKIKSLTGGKCKLKMGKRIEEFETEKGKSYNFKS